MPPSTLSLSEPIGRNAFLGVTGAFSGIAIICAIIRIHIRFRQLKGIRVDDYLFLAAAIIKVAADGFLFASFSRQPMAAYAAYRASQAQGNEGLIKDLGAQLTLAKLNEVFDWASIFLIKLCFLSYFRGFVDRLSKFKAWWWLNLALLLPTTAVIISAAFIVCPALGITTVVKCAGPAFSRRERVMIYYSVASDIVTDIMLMSIPMLLLRKIRVDLRTKFTIGMITCLSLFMVAMALVRAISFNIVGSRNQWWITFWVHLEASVSVIAACPIAYRNLFVIKQREERMLRVTNHDRHRRSVLEAIWRKTRPTLPSIGVGAEMTGMSTALRGDDERSQSDLKTEDGTLISSTAEGEESNPSWKAHRLSIQEEETAIGQAV